jgi:hypothetical protein
MGDGKPREGRNGQAIGNVSLTYLDILRGSTPTRQIPGLNERTEYSLATQAMTRHDRRKACDLLAQNMPHCKCYITISE